VLNAWVDGEPSGDIAVYQWCNRCGRVLRGEEKLSDLCPGCRDVRGKQLGDRLDQLTDPNHPDYDPKLHSEVQQSLPSVENELKLRRVSRLN